MRQSDLTAVVDFIVKRFALDLSVEDREELECDIEDAVHKGEEE